MQIKDNVNAANLLSVAANMTGIGKADGKTEGIESNDFASILSASSDKAKGNDAVKEDKYDFISKTIEKNEKSSNNNNKTTSANEDRIKDNKINEKSKVNNQTDNKVASDNSNNSDNSNDVVNEDDMEQISETISTIVVLLEEKLGVSAEEINDLMDQMGMDMSDLLNEDSIKEIFLGLQSADISDILTDETLKNNLTELTAEFEQIVEELPVSVEEAVKLLDDNDIKFDDVVNYGSDDALNESESDIQNESSNTPYVEVNDERKSDNTNLERSTKKSGHIQDENAGHFENPILQGINDAVANVEDVSSVVPNTRPADIVEQIIEQVRVNINQDNTSMEMQLYPEHLGRIQINVISKDGVMTARIAAETETARQAIEAGLNNLKESLENQNLKVDAIEVMVSTTGFASSDERQDDYQQQSTGNRGKRLIFSDLDEDISEEDEEIERMRATNSGSSVTYLA